MKIITPRKKLVTWGVKRPNINSRTRNQAHIKEAFSQNQNSSVPTAYHGTSLEVLQRIIDLGYQPGVLYKKENGRRKGDVSVFPINERTRYSNEYSFLSEEEAFRASQTYAERISQETYFFDSIGMKFAHIINSDSGSDWCEFVESFSKKTPEDQPQLKQLYVRGFSREKLLDIISKARKRKGIILGYKDEIFQKGNPIPGDEKSDVSVQFISLQDIVYVEPLDQFSWDFLSSL